MIVLCNSDQPGVIGDVGTILGQHGVNIGTFALGRDGDRAVGVVIVDEPPDKPVPEVVLDELRRLKTIREARLVRV
jgi:D-3-phosphoglycerate dehydrogenase